MPKQQTPVVDTQATRLNDPAAAVDPRNTGHPLLKHAHSALEGAQRRANAQDKEEVIIERIEEWKECVNRLSLSNDGKHFLKMLIKHSGLHAIKKGAGAERLLKLEGMQAFYLEFVRPYLEPEQRHGIE